MDSVMSAVTPKLIRAYSLSFDFDSMLCSRMWCEYGSSSFSEYMLGRLAARARGERAGGEGKARMDRSWSEGYILADVRLVSGLACHPAGSDREPGASLVSIGLGLVRHSTVLVQPASEHATRPRLYRLPDQRHDATLMSQHSSRSPWASWRNPSSPRKCRCLLHCKYVLVCATQKFSRTVTTQKSDPIMGCCGVARVLTSGQTPGALCRRHRDSLSLQAARPIIHIYGMRTHRGPVFLPGAYVRPPGASAADRLHLEQALAHSERTSSSTTPACPHWHMGPHTAEDMHSWSTYTYIHTYISMSKSLRWRCVRELLHSQPTNHNLAMTSKQGIS